LLNTDLIKRNEEIDNITKFSLLNIKTTCTSNKKLGIRCQLLTNKQTNKQAWQTMYGIDKVLTDFTALLYPLSSTDTEQVNDK